MDDILERLVILSDLLKGRSCDIQRTNAPFSNKHHRIKFDPGYRRKTDVACAETRLEM